MAKTVIKTYETVFIVDSLFEDEKVDTIIRKYTDLLTKEGCEIVKTDKWGRRKLAFNIKKRNSGHYISIEFQGPAKVISRLERAYHIDDNILRFLTISFDKKTYELRKDYLVRKVEADARREADAAALRNASLGITETEIPKDEIITPDTEAPTEEASSEKVEPGQEEQQA